MNWLKTTLRFGEKIKQLLKKRPSKSDIENSDWASCCKGPILKKRSGRKFMGMSGSMWKTF